MDLYIAIVAVSILMSIALGWSIGANDAANSLGAAVGARVITMRQALYMIALFGLMGAIMQGQYVAKTIGKGVVPLDQLDSNMASVVALTAAGAACLWVVIATYLKMPISTSHSIVGAVAGAGLALHMQVRWHVICDIFLCWIFTPLGAAVLGFVLYAVLRKVFPLVCPARWTVSVQSAFVVLTGCYVAFTWGANDVANATGLLAGTDVLSVRDSILLGGLSIVLGIITWGYKVIETVGGGITRLLPLMALSAQLASGLNVHAYTLMGIPVSTSHSIVGAIVGVGWVQGIKVVNLGIMKEIVVCWVATPFVSGVLAFGLLKLVTHFI